MPTCKKCGDAFPNTLIIDGKRRNLSSRKYCLTCSPFGQHNTKQLHKDDPPTMRCICRDCGRAMEYDRSKGHRKHRCNSCRAKRRRKSTKQRLVDRFGGECGACGYSGCLSALVFHHRDPDEKKFGICGNEYNREWEAVVEEAKKCDLLCRNCHAEYHCTRC